MTRMDDAEFEDAIAQAFRFIAWADGLHTAGLQHLRDEARRARAEEARLRAVIYKMAPPTTLTPTELHDIARAALAGDPWEN
jgi:hypothetical protein